MKASEGRKILTSAGWQLRRRTEQGHEQWQPPDDGELQVFAMNNYRLDRNEVAALKRIAKEYQQVEKDERRRRRQAAAQSRAAAQPPIEQGETAMQFAMEQAGVRKSGQVPLRVSITRNQGNHYLRVWLDPKNYERLTGKSYDRENFALMNFTAKRENDAVILERDYNGPHRIKKPAPSQESKNVAFIDVNVNKLVLRADSVYAETIRGDVEYGRLEFRLPPQYLPMPGRKPAAAPQPVPAPEPVREQPTTVGALLEALDAQLKKANNLADDIRQLDKELKFDVGEDGSYVAYWLKGSPR